jgi:hypothetical protein
MESALNGSEELLADAATQDSYLAEALSQYDAAIASGGNVAVSLQVDSATEQLNQLKFQFIEVCTKQLFLEKIAAAAAHDGESMPCPSMQELAASELAAEQAKAALKKAKSARASTSQQLEAVCRDVASAYVDCEDARSTCAKRIHDVRAGMRLRDVTNTLEKGTPEDMAKLAERVDEHDAKSCEQILSFMFSELTEKENAKKSAEQDVAVLQTVIDGNVKEQAKLNTKLAEYRAEIEEHERSNPDAPKIREESMHHQQVYQTMCALTRARVAAVYDGGIRAEVSVDRRVEHERDDGEVDESTCVPVLYMLDLTLGHSNGKLVTKLGLSPSDIDVSNLVSESHPLPMLQVVQDVIHMASSTPLRKQTTDCVDEARPASERSMASP